ncbi:MULTISPECIES: MarR family winged helix-turn-helix transcriptional regulator [unclassified Salinivibrio]|uniref:MarR family winged helix-turn-helix transcriptional regulator n=1 Tax=unclassified Salinivibrio TaxID=2636825 RepID=UPI001D0CE97D|nr:MULTISPECIES: MarR family transcriptional regulator [unclassified Salinivibrio]
MKLTDMTLPHLALDSFLPYKLVHTAELVADSLAARYEAEFGLSRPEWRVLASLGARDGVMAKDLAAETRLDKVKVSRLLTRLEQHQLVERRACQGDQRAALVHLTDKGRTHYQTIVPKVLEWETAMLEGLSAAQYQALYQALDALQHRVLELAQTDNDAASV